MPISPPPLPWIPRALASAANDAHVETNAAETFAAQHHLKKAREKKRQRTGQSIGSPRERKKPAARILSSSSSSVGRLLSGSSSILVLPTPSQSGTYPKPPVPQTTPHRTHAQSRSVFRIFHRKKSAAFSLNSVGSCLRLVSVVRVVCAKRGLAAADTRHLEVDLWPSRYIRFLPNEPL